MMAANRLREGHLICGPEKRMFQKLDQILEVEYKCDTVDSPFDLQFW